MKKMHLFCLSMALPAFLYCAVSSAAVMPYSPEQKLMDMGLWPANVSHGAYQSRDEFPFFDSAVDTCPDAWPYHPKLIEAGMSGCYDLRPPNMTYGTVIDCTGNSAALPAPNDNVYIIRQANQDTGWSQADNSIYRWVLRCVGTGADRRVITASGVGLSAGQLRIYDCLDADGVYRPTAQFQVQRTGTANECHEQQIFISSRYTWVRNVYVEANTFTRGQAAVDLDGSTMNPTGQDLYSGFDNFDVYLGGQTVTNSGFTGGQQGWRVRQASLGWGQNFRIVDCLARRGNDGDGATFGNSTDSHNTIVNGEIVNCPHPVFGGSGATTVPSNAQGHSVENIWVDSTGDRNFGDVNKAARRLSAIDPRYWWDVYAQDAKIPYGSVAGNPPSYVKAAAASDAEVDPAFNCGGDKYSDDCWMQCMENFTVGFKFGASPGQDPIRVRRIVMSGDGPARTGRRDTNNPVSNGDDGTPPGQTFSTCGGSSGTQYGMTTMDGQQNAYGIERDLIISDSQNPSWMAGCWPDDGGNDEEQCGSAIKNSILVATWEPWQNNVYTDGWAAYIVDNAAPSEVVGQGNYLHFWGTTLKWEGDFSVTGRSTREWLGRTNIGSGESLDMHCLAVVDIENGARGDTEASPNWIASYGRSEPLNNSQNVMPSLNTTYATTDLKDFCYVRRPFTAIADGVEPVVKCISNVWPASDSPTIAQCPLPVPF